MDTKEYVEIKDLLHKQDIKLTRIEEKVDDYKDVKDTSNKAFILAQKNEQEIKELQERNKWLIRTIAGAIITGVIGIVFILIKLSVGIGG